MSPDGKRPLRLMSRWMTIAAAGVFLDRTFASLSARPFPSRDRDVRSRNADANPEYPLSPPR